MAYAKADGQESAVSQRPGTPCVSWSPQNAPFFTVSRRHRSKGIGGEFIEGPFQWPSNMHTRSREQHGRRGSVSKGPSINVLCQKVQTIETVKVDTDWCVYKPAENAHVRFRMPRAFRSRQFLIDLALKGSLHFPTVSSTFSVSGRFICGILNDKHTYFCRRCSWTCRQRSANRLFEHAVFGKHVKLSSYLDIHGLESKNQVPQETQQFIERYRGTGNCTAPYHNTASSTRNFPTSRQGGSCRHEGFQHG